MWGPVAGYHHHRVLLWDQAVSQQCSWIKIFATHSTFYMTRPHSEGLKHLKASIKKRLAFDNISGIVAPSVVNMAVLQLNPCQFAIKSILVPHLDTLNPQFNHSWASIINLCTVLYYCRYNNPQTGDSKESEGIRWRFDSASVCGPADSVLMELKVSLGRVIARRFQVQIPVHSHLPGISRELEHCFIKEQRKSDSKGFM